MYLISILCLVFVFTSHDSPFFFHNEKWKQAINAKTGEIQSLYTDNALSLREDNAGTGTDEIGQLYETDKSLWNKIEKVFTDFEKTDMNTQSVRYEIGGFTTSNGKTYSHLIVWSGRGEDALREVEVIIESEDSNKAITGLEQRRIDWVKGSNSHDLVNFLKELYQMDAYYYWNSANRLYRGENIQKAFSYMSSPNWKIESLTPYYTKQVSGEIVFEVGKYHGNGGTGDYCIVWKKDEKGKWKVLLDSNY